jgi:deoxyhypusine synthase
MSQRPSSRRSPYLSGDPIDPPPLRGSRELADVVDGSFLAYNAGRLRAACRLFAERMLEPDVTVGLSLSGALTPAGLGRSCVVPLLRAGFVDWIVSTGANLYHDAHYALGFRFRQGSARFDDRDLLREGVVRIYDVVFEYEVLLETDRFLRQIVRSPRFARRMSTAEFHYLLGEALIQRNEAVSRASPAGDGGTRPGAEDPLPPFECVLTAAARAAVPIYVSSPGDSSIGMNVAEVALSEPVSLQFDVLADVNETTALVFDAKRSGGKSAVVLLGGGSPKNFVLQTEPQIKEVFGLDEEGHDYYLQVTDARPDTGGLSGATPSEAVSWGKVDPTKLEESVVAYCDTTIALPVLTSYALARRPARPSRRLYDRRGPAMDALRAAVAERRSKLARAPSPG